MSLQRVTFEGAEYQEDTTFKLTQYTFVQTKFIAPGVGHWEIYRQEDLVGKLESNYALVKVAYCGLCSTEFYRHLLPFPLPQITGHEIVGYAMDDNYQWTRRVAVEINASHYACEDRSAECQFCSPEAERLQPGINRHCPTRYQIGIEFLPGGLAPYVLAPVGCLADIPPELPMRRAAIWEPFAAAWWGIVSNPPPPNSTVAVLGPRKLGMLLVAALAIYKCRHCPSLSVTAVARHSSILDMCKEFGADETLLLKNIDSQVPTFDIVYDTTGTPDGLKIALQMARKEVHLKSTNGAHTFGLDHLTQFVVDELCMRKFTPDAFDFRWACDSPDRRNRHVLVAPSVDKQYLDSLLSDTVKSQFEFHYAQLENISDHSGRYDIAIVSSLKDIDRVIRPLGKTSQKSLIRPRGLILLLHDNAVSPTSNPLWDSIVERNLILRSTRCGDGRDALRVLSEEPQISERVEKMFTHEFSDLSKMNEILAIAKDSNKCIKALVKLSD